MKRWKFDAEFETKVAVEAIRGLKTLSRHLLEYEFYPIQIRQ